MNWCGMQFQLNIIEKNVEKTEGNILDKSNSHLGSDIITEINLTGGPVRHCWITSPGLEQSAADLPDRCLNFHAKGLQTFVKVGGVVENAIAPTKLRA